MAPMTGAPEPGEDALTLPGCDAEEVARARQAAGQLLDRFRRGRSQEAIELITGLVSPGEGAGGDG